MLTNSIAQYSIKQSRELAQPWPKIEEGDQNMTENGVVQEEGETIYAEEEEINH